MLIVLHGKIQMIRHVSSIELTLMEWKLNLQVLSCLVFSAGAQSPYSKSQKPSDLEMRWEYISKKCKVQSKKSTKWKALKILLHINTGEDI